MKSYVFRLVRFLWASVFYQIVINIMEYLPNIHQANLIRGRFVGCFVKAHGQRFAVAAGCRLIMLRELEVGDDVYIAHDCWLNAAGGIKIGDGVIISPKVVIASTKHQYKKGAVLLHSSEKAAVTIGDGAWIASHSTVTKGVAVGRGVIVGAGSVVTKSLPDYHFCAGQPAVPIKKLV